MIRQSKSGGLDALARSRPFHRAGGRDIRHGAGFTLIEMMIVVAVIAILSAIALPSYREYVARGYRAEARAGLMQAAHWLERVATATGSYPARNTFPEALKQVPSGTYTVTYAPDTTGGFTLTATAQGAQANDRCGNYILTNTGTRGPADPADCWGK